WIATWIGIVLADWYFGDRTVHPIPPGWTRGATIFAVVSVLTIALFSTSSLYTGPVARWLGGADIGYYVGFFAAAFWYALGMPRRISS
ncbi:hypothetical protein FKW23_16045, partial [Acetobacter sp. DmW_125123]